LPAVQSLHNAPPVPHDGPVCAAYSSQVPAAVQHPPGQVFASHPQEPVVVSQSPSAQAPHFTPAAPHWLGDCDA
jgi:hypothetical protein